MVLVLAFGAACGPAAGAGGSSTGGPPGKPPVSVPSSPAPALRIRAASLHTGVAGSGAYARVGWWGGIPTCQGVASSVGRHDLDIVVILTPTEVAAKGTACPDIAMQRTTMVRLGALPPGSYTVRAGGKRAPLVVS